MPGSDPDADRLGEREPDRKRQREIVHAFLAASRDGDFEALVRMLAPDVVLRADAVTVAMVRTPRSAGLGAWRRPSPAGRRPYGWPSLTVMQVRSGRWGVVFAFTVHDDRVTVIELVAEPDRIAALDLELLA